jgi:hypothetical protein
MEINLRKRIEAKAPGELANRRGELGARRVAEAERSPGQERLDGLERRIATGNARLAELAKERAGLMGESLPGGERLSRIEANHRRTTKQVGRLEDERDTLAAEVANEVPPAGLSAGERAELAVIEDRLTHLAREKVRAARAHTPKMIEESLGARPKDPVDAALWNVGVNAIYSYRLRYGITSDKGHPLGPKSRDAARSRDRRQAEIRITQMQQRLAKQRVRRAERGMRIAR